MLPELVVRTLERVEMGVGRGREEEGFSLIVVLEASRGR